MTILFGLVNFNYTTEGTVTATANANIDDLFLINQFNTFTLPILNISIPIPSLSFFENVGKMLVWQYPFFTGHWNLVRIFLFMPLTFAASLVFIQALGPVMTGLAAAMGDFIGRIFPF